MLEQLKREVCRANLDLVQAGLVIQTWGNASGIDRRRGLMVIKPSGVPYDGMMPRHMVVVSLRTARSSRAGSSRVRTPPPTWCFTARFPASAASSTRTAFTPPPGPRRARPAGSTAPRRRTIATATCLAPARSRRANSAPITRRTRAASSSSGSGSWIPTQHPAVLVASHGPFTWGKDVADAVHNAVVLEFVARLASETLRLNPKAKPVPSRLAR